MVGLLAYTIFQAVWPRAAADAGREPPPVLEAFEPSLTAADTVSSIHMVEAERIRQHPSCAIIPNSTE